MYKALYRQYRPKKFSDVVGQEIIVKTLENSLELNKVGHAYLFAGPKGTGKTSVAKIFSKKIEGINLYQSDDNIADIVEIDAASNNGVDEIRNLRDSTNYAPLHYPYKIYIIDEVHMLSKGAFNALLKTLEDPPEQVKFILATTEPQKVPATILSRVQRFNFRRLTKKQIISRLKFILKDQKIDFENEALSVIADSSEGAMRDSLSILDEVIALSKDNKVYAKYTYKITGSTKFSQQSNFIKSILKKDIFTTFKNVHNLFLERKDPIRFQGDLLALLKNIILAKADPKLVNENIRKEIIKISALVSNFIIEKIINIATDTFIKMKQTNRPELYLEIFSVEAISFIKKNEKISDNLKEKKYPSVTKPNNILNGTATNNDKLSISDDKKNVQKNIKPTFNTNKTNTNKTQRDKINSKAKQKQHDINKGHFDKKSNLFIKKEKDINTETSKEKAWTVMNIARKSELKKVTQAWLRFSGDNQPSFSTLINNCKPVVASKNNLIFSFSHKELADAAISTPNFVSWLSKNFFISLKTKYNFIFISDGLWYQLKKKYINQLKTKTKKDKETNSFYNKTNKDLKKNNIKNQINTYKENSKKPKNSTNKNEKNKDVIDKAQKLFGDIVKVKGKDY